MKWVDVFHLIALTAKSNQVNPPTPLDRYKKRTRWICTSEEVGDTIVIDPWRSSAYQEILQLYIYIYRPYMVN